MTRVAFVYIVANSDFIAGADILNLCAKMDISSVVVEFSSRIITLNHVFKLMYLNLRFASIESVMHSAEQVPVLIYPLYKRHKAKYSRAFEQVCKEELV